MKTEKLMDYIGQIDDNIILEADTHAIDHRSIRRLWIRRGSVMAAAVLMAAITLTITRKVPSDFSGLPQLPVNTESGAMGFEGLLAYEISELQNGNPWTENNDLATMPVFTNPNEYDGAGVPINGLSAEEMLLEAENIADLFGLEISALYTEPTLEQIERIQQKLESVQASEEELRQSTDVCQATAACNGAEIEVQKDGQIFLTLTPDTAGLVKEIDKLSIYDNFTVSFECGNIAMGDTLQSMGLPLPDGYRFSFQNTSNEQALETTRYLFSEYGAFTGITTPGYDLSADYTFSGVLTRLRTFVFENAGSLRERILNYHFNRLSFSATDSGGLGRISYSKTDLSQKIGDYPIITAREARKLLMENHYITTVPEALPGEEYIARVELMYRTGRWDSVFMPYYLFLVEMPTMEQENGLKTFGAFYVPAVQGKFLENMPLWDGSFQ